MNQFADIILPLAVSQPYTYRLPQELAGRVVVGSRVVVPLGRRKYYTGIVFRLRATLPATVDASALKDVAELVDDHPLLLPAQLQFWEWMAQYYMCTLGEVMKAALPSGLKLESESVVRKHPDFSDFDALTERESRVLDALSAEKGESLASLQRELNIDNILPLVRRLLERDAVVMEEKMTRQYRPKTEKHVRLAADFQDENRLNEVFGNLKRTPKQSELLLKYLEFSKASTAFALSNMELLEEVARRDLLRLPGASEFALSALVGKGILEVYDYEVGRLKTQKALPELLTKELNPAQQQAYEEIMQSASTPVLLHGVTSSGKTEIYIRLIEEALQRGEQVLYLLPEIALTTQIMTRLSRVFGDKLGVYHSKFPDAERVELWQRQLSERPFPLILGVRSSLFLPFRKLGLIIVDEEHETSYKQQDPAPRYNARDAALVLARFTGARVLLGTATPAVETYHNALSGKYRLVELTTRYGDRQLPEIVVEDVKELRRKKLMKSPFSPRLTEEIREALAHHEQVILFQNRRGYSPVLECHTCGWTPHCEHCDVPLTYHQQQGRLVCHYCGTPYPLPQQCPNCGSTELRDLGYGTEKIQAAVRAFFPEARTARMDLDTTRSRSSYERILEAFGRGETDILIGTQMVTKGLDFERVHVVGILNADQSLNVPDFRAFERSFQMLSQVAGRAGRKGRRGLVVFQTRQPQLPVVQQIVTNDYRAMYASQLVERREFLYPPFCRIINIFVRHRDERICEDAAQKFAQSIRPYFQSDLLGPDRPAVARIQALYIRKMMLKVRPTFSAASIRRTLLSARDVLLARPELKGVQLYFDVDPL